MQVGKNGRNIPLDPATELPHDCPMRDKPSQQQPYPKEEKKSFDEVAEQIRNDHGNELKQDTTKSWQHMNVLGDTEAAQNKPYVDHTLKPELKLKTLTDPTPEGIDLKYNNFAKEHKIRYSQSHVLGSQYTVYVWYEDSGK